MNWGGGIYLNYLFTAVWLADCVWWRVAPDTYRDRSRAWNVTIHGFLAFMVVNASVVVWAIRIWRKF